MKPKSQFLFILLSLVLWITFTACAGQPEPTEPPALAPEAAQPGVDTALPAAPEDQRLDPQVLEAMVKKLEDYPSQEIHSLLILHNGQIAAEKYFHSYDQDSKHTLFSCTKSVVSALVGIAIGEGAIQSVDQPVSDFFPEAIAANPDPRKSAMRLEDVLMMRTGLDWDEGNPAYRSLYSTNDWVTFMLEKPMLADPGSQFNYCSGCTHILSGIVYQSTGMLTQEFAETRLFAPLGITDYTWETDAVGNAIGGWGLELTTRDMAKFGALFLNNGSWEGKQVVPAAWVQQSIQSAKSTDGSWDYGYQWWTQPSENLYAAQGLHGQKIYVVPGKNLVVVVTAGADDSGVVGDLVLTAAVNAVR